MPGCCPDKNIINSKLLYANVLLGMIKSVEIKFSLNNIMYFLCIIAKRAECERYDYTTTLEETDNELKRQPKKKKFDDFITGILINHITADKILHIKILATARMPNVQKIKNNF